MNIHAEPFVLESDMNIDAEPFVPESNMNIDTEPFVPESKMNIDAEPFVPESKMFDDLEKKFVKNNPWIFEDEVEFKSSIKRKLDEVDYSDDSTEEDFTPEKATYADMVKN